MAIGPSCLVVHLAVLPGKISGLQRNVVQPLLTTLQELSLVWLKRQSRCQRSGGYPVVSVGVFGPKTSSAILTSDIEMLGESVGTSRLFPMGMEQLVCIGMDEGLLCGIFW